MRYHVTLTWDPESFVWAASSPDITGLVLEDASQDRLRERVRLAVPELLEVTSGIRRTTPFYAMLFGMPGIRYQRGVVRESYAKVDYR